MPSRTQRWQTGRTLHPTETTGEEDEVRTRTLRIILWFDQRPEEPDVDRGGSSSTMSSLRRVFRWKRLGHGNTCNTFPICLFYLFCFTCIAVVDWYTKQTHLHGSEAISSQLSFRSSCFGDASVGFTGWGHQPISWLTSWKGRGWRSWAANQTISCSTQCGQSTSIWHLAMVSHGGGTLN